MLDSFIFSFNSIAPIFVVVVLGAILKKIGFLKDGFLPVCDKFVFNICLPCLLFQDIASTDISESLNVNLILYCVAAITVTTFIPCVVVPLFIKDKAKCGAFVQGVFRANSAILGITLAVNMFGDLGKSVTAMVLPFTVVLFNVYSVIVMTIFAPSDHKMAPKQLLLHILKSIVTNPLIVAIVLALLWQRVPAEIPTAVDKSLSYLADMSMPMALISLGASINMESLRGRIGLAVGASIGKTILVPLLVISVAALLGYRGVELVAVFTIFGTPAAVSSYIMAKQMKSDHELAGQILLVSTLMSLFTMFVWIFALRQFGLI